MCVALYEVYCSVVYVYSEGIPDCYDVDAFDVRIFLMLCMLHYFEVFLTVNEMNKKVIEIFFEICRHLCS